MTKPDTLWGPRHRPVMTALISIIAIASYNNLAATAVLPDIGDDLGRINLLPWVITIELLTSAVAVLAAGPIVDSAGVRKTFQFAGIGFMITSIIVAVAPSMPALIAARAVQGIFAGGVMTVATAGIGVAIPSALRPRAFAAISTVWGVMGVAGPAIAAVLVAVSSWRAIFIANIPVTAIALLIGWNELPDRRVTEPQGVQSPAPGSGKRIDGVGLVLVTVITAAALSLTAATPVVVVGGAATMAASVVIYRWWAKRNPEPILRLPHLSALRYRSVHLTSMAVLAAGVGVSSLLPLYIRGVRQQSATVAAFSVLYMTVGWTAGAWLSSRLQDRWRGETVSVLGSIIAFPSAVAVAVVIHLDAALPLVYVAFVWLGVGVGTITSTGAAVLQNRTELAEMGRLNGAHQFLRTISLTIGIAAVAAITLAVVNHRVGDVEAVRELLSDDPESVPAGLINALGDGYAWAATAAAAIASVTVPAALHLFRTRRHHIGSAR
ncbi:MAG: MFS transporter [Acidimicrobiaceae bacterium]|nr:MFS transporter [Acidimicrobiaceae bacterium]MYD05401.1 MFS transporter [Acidimicrobiaceae bacterium]MYI59860.1 MFS transporter [Acidimicrobiaceae bacterium]